MNKSIFKIVFIITLFTLMLGLVACNPNTNTNRVPSGSNSDNADESDSQGVLVYNDAKNAILGVKDYTVISVVIPDGVTLIASKAFEKCENLETLVIPDSVTSIADSAFSDCTNLRNVTMPALAIEYIPKIRLREINITSGKSIGASALADCSNLTSLTLPFVGASVDDTTNTHLGYIFGASTYNSNSNKIPSTLKTVKITGVTSIGNYAFYGCSGLTSITIPNRVTSIGNYAFYGCNSLTSIVIPDSVTSIGNNAFSSCSSVTSINIPDSVTEISDSAFSGCSGLTSVTIPNSVTSIGSYAFSSCDVLKRINFSGTKAQWQSIEKLSWRGNIIRGTITIYCIDGTIDA